MDKIDFIVTWVDGNDSKWLEEKRGYSVGDDEFCNNNHYRDYGLLKYIFRGIEKFTPWVNHVYFVTCGQVPDWLNLDCGKVTLVCHEDFVDAKYLPVFSINPIEINLHKIKGLSEKFVYFNDDTFIINEMNPSDFFKADLPCDTAIMTPLVPSEGSDMISHVILNDMLCINRHFTINDIRKMPRKMFSPSYGLDIFRNVLFSLWPNVLAFKNYHLPSSFLKKTFFEVWENNQFELEKTMRHRFRSKDDINQYLMRYWQFLKGDFYPSAPNGKYFDINMLEEIVAYINGNGKMICINDVDVDDWEAVQGRLCQTFEAKLPQKSIYEK